MKTAFWLHGYCGFNGIISFTFQAVKNPTAHPTYLCSVELFRIFFFSEF